MQIATHAGVKALLAQHGLKARKSLGQNFLVDPHVLGKIIRAANIGPGDWVLEIGPGLGGLTQALAEAAGAVCAVELDRILAAILQTTFADFPTVEIVHSDIMAFDIAAQTVRFPALKHKVVANLPYYISTAVTMHLLEHFAFDSLTVMVQREVAERMTAKPGSAAYGSLSLAVQYQAEAHIAAYVPQNCFLPRPRVDSAVVHLERLAQPRVSGDRAALFALIRAGFGQRRKTLVNCLHSAELYPASKAELAEVIGGLWDAHIRGETLALEDWATLSEALRKRWEEDVLH